MTQNHLQYMSEEKLVLADDAKTAEEKVEKTEAELKAEAAAVEAEKAKAEQETVYKKELAKLEAEKQEKADALTVERSKRKAAEKANEALVEATKETKVSPTTEDINKLLDERLAQRDFDQLVKQEAIDPDEQKLIKHHYENSIRRTGNVAADLKMAAAIANQHLVEQAKQAQIEREQNEGLQANFQSSRPYSRQGKPGYETNGTLKAAASILEKLGVPEAKKFLK